MNKPKVGIFWAVPACGEAVLVTDTSLLSESEVYGEFLTHAGGHYDVWEAWRRSGTVGLAQQKLPAAILWHEYEQCPRGRVVYHRQSELFTIYADRQLQGAAMVARILAAFSLEAARHVVRGDAHYRAARGKAER